MLISRRTKVILILVLLLLTLLVGGWIFWKLFSSGPVVEPAQVVDTTPEPNEPARTPERATPSIIAGEDRAATVSIQSLAKTFTERFGSYSTEANFENLTDVLPLMTAAYAGETQAFLATAVSPSEYYGVTTRIVSIRVLASDETAGTASVEVSTQREEAKGSVQNVSIRYQMLSLSLLKENGAWKVNAATWE